MPLGTWNRRVGRPSALISARVAAAAAATEKGLQRCTACGAMLDAGELVAIPADSMERRAHPGRAAIAGSVRSVNLSDSRPQGPLHRWGPPPPSATAC